MPSRCAGRRVQTCCGHWAPDSPHPPLAAPRETTRGAGLLQRERARLAFRSGSVHSLGRTIRAIHQGATMNRLFAKPFVAAAVALGAVGVAGAAHARTDVFFSV